jgi:hypothetical protein
MDPFFKAVGGAISVIVIFFVAVFGGRILAALAVKDRNAQQAATGLFAVAIFLLLFFLFRR